MLRQWSQAAKCRSLLHHCGLELQQSLNRRAKSVCWQHWRSRYTTLIHHKAVLQTAVTRLQNRAVSSAFDAWLDYTQHRLQLRQKLQHRLQLRQKLQQTVGKLMHGSLARGLPMGQSLQHLLAPLSPPSCEDAPHCLAFPEPNCCQPVGHGLFSVPSAEAI